jgi:hypothetical protein
MRKKGCRTSSHFQAMGEESMGEQRPPAATPRAGAIPLAISVLAFARSTAFTRIELIASAAALHGSAGQRAIGR